MLSMTVNKRSWDRNDDNRWRVKPRSSLTVYALHMVIGNNRRLPAEIIMRNPDQVAIETRADTPWQKPSNDNRCPAMLSNRRRKSYKQAAQPTID